MFAGAGQRLVLMLVLEKVRLKAGPLYKDSKTFKSVPLNQAKHSPCTREKVTICLALSKSGNLDGLRVDRNMLLILILFCLTSSSPGTKLSWRIKLRLNQILEPPHHHHSTLRYLQQESADFGTDRCINHLRRHVAHRNKSGSYKGLYGIQRYGLATGPLLTRRHHIYQLLNTE